MQKVEPPQIAKNLDRLAWNKLREVTGVICDKKVPVKLKHKIYKTVIRPNMTYGVECWTMKKKDAMLMNKTEMRMLRWIQCVSLREHTRNEVIRETETVQPIATHLMRKRLRWYGHVRRRDESHTTRTVLDMVVEGVRPRGRPKLRYMNTIKRAIKKNGLTDVNILDRKDRRLAVSRAWKSLQCEKKVRSCDPIWPTEHCHFVFKFKNIILGMGAFHTICKLLSTIGKRFQDAGLSDLCVCSLA